MVVVVVAAAVGVVGVIVVVVVVVAVAAVGGGGCVRRAARVFVCARVCACVYAYACVRGTTREFPQSILQRQQRAIAMLLEGRGYRGWGIGVIKTIKYQGDGAGPVGGGQNSDTGVACSSDYGDVRCGVRGDVRCGFGLWVVVGVAGLVLGLVVGVGEECVVMVRL